jgi:L-lactate utilization protein LutB
MGQLPPLLVVEPSAEEGSRRAAGVFARKEKPPDGTSLKARLTDLRRSAAREHAQLRDAFERALAAFPGVQTSSAATASEAASRIAEIAGSTRLASLNRSSVVTNELRPELSRRGFRTHVRYYTEFRNFDPKTFQSGFEGYWSLPGLHERGLFESFRVRKTFSYLPSSGRRDYVAVLGVNAVSAGDGSIYFLQHAANISKDLEQAKVLVLVVSLERILPDAPSALFQVRATGTFGLESLLLDLAPSRPERFDFEALEPSAGGGPPRVHVLFFDNGRSELLSGDFHELFHCVDCRACARQCPVGQHLLFEPSIVFSPKNYLFAFLRGLVPSVEGCLHCGRCLVECPVGIDLPALLWRSQLRHYERRGRPWKKRMLDDPELLAKLGSLSAPLSNWLTGQPAVKACLASLAGVHRRAPLPTFRRETFRAWLDGGRRD